jgi:Transglycosylase SLT domain
MSDDSTDLTPVYDEAGRQNGIDPDLLRAQTHVESTDNDYAISSAGAEGRSQFIPSTAERMGLRNPFDPREAIPAQAKLLRQNLDKFGSLDMAVAAYHGGTDPAQWGDKTRNYWNRVADVYAQHKAAQPKQEADDWVTPKQAAPAPADDWITPTEGVPMTNRQAVKQLPAAQTETAAPLPPVQHVNQEPPQQPTAPGVRERYAKSNEAIGNAIVDAWNNSPGLLTPEAQSWLDKTGLGGVTRLADAVFNSGPSAIFAGGLEALNQLGGRHLAEIGEAEMTRQMGETGAPHVEAPEMPRAAAAEPLERPPAEAPPTVAPEAPKPAGPAAPAATPAPEAEPGQPMLSRLAKQAHADLAAIAKEEGVEVPKFEEAAPAAEQPGQPTAAPPMGTPAPEAPIAQPQTEIEPETPRQGDAGAKASPVATPEPPVAEPPAAEQPPADVPVPPMTPLQERHAQVSAAEAERSQAEEQGTLPTIEVTPKPQQRGTTTPFEATPKEPQRLIDFLRSKTILAPSTIHEQVLPGGIRDAGGDIRAILGGSNGRPGLINNASGMSLHDKLIQAWENGYLPEYGEEPPTDDRALLDAIRDDHMGTARYSMHDQDRVEAYQSATEGNREIDRLASEHGIETRGKTRDQFFDELHDRMSMDERAQEIASQTEAHEAAYREAEKQAKQWVAENQGQGWNAKELYGISQARTLEDLEREHAEEAQPHPTAPAAGERAASIEEPGPPGGDQGAVPEGGEPRGGGAGDADRGPAPNDQANGQGQHWLNSLNPDQREQANAAILAQENDMLRHYNGPAQGGYGLSVGAGGFDEIMRAEVPREFLTAIRKGMDPAQAEDFAKEQARQFVIKHNAQRPKDINWKRSPDAYGDIANLARVKMDVALREPAKTDLLGKPVAEPRAKALPEPTIRNDTRQDVMPGMEPSATQAQAARDAQGRGALQTDVKQKPADEGLFAPDTSGQGTLYAGPGAIFDPQAWRRAFGPFAPAAIRAVSWAKRGTDAIANGLAPMRTGSVRAQAWATDFANSLRQVNFHYGEIDHDIERRYKPSERADMGKAMDAQSVFEQQLRDMPADQQAAARAQFDAGGTGLAGLRPDQQNVLRMLDTVSQSVWQRMRQRGMVSPQARGLPFYFPRQILTWSEENGFESPGGGGQGGGRNIEPVGGNLTTQGPMRREHLTPEETEAAAQSKFGPGAAILTDIRMLPSRLAQAERAIAGSDLMSQIERVGNETGVNLVTRGDIPGLLNPADYFTIEQHPAFRQFTGTGWKAIHVSKEFEGPLKAVLTKSSGDLYRGAMALKSGVMSAIMYSPFIHLAVELGRSLPVMPLRVMTLQALRDGSRLRADMDYMDRATTDGLAPLGRQGWRTDPISLADQANDQGGNRFVRAIKEMRDNVARGAGAVLGQTAQDIIQHPHQALLWDQVFNLQVGLYDGMRNKWIEKGYPPEVAGQMAAHIANRYAGALPPEHLARGANMAANMLLFSRSFTLGNLGVMKDMLTGAPGHLVSRLQQMAGPDVAKSAQSAMRRKAIAAFTMDVGMFYLANGLLQSGLQVLRNASSQGGLGPAAQQTFNDWYDGATSAIQGAGNNPLSIFGVLPQHWNEPGKQDRVYAGTDDQQRGIYLRLPAGKVGEEFLGWFAKPGTMLVNKASPLVRPIIEDAIGYDSLGRAIYKPNPQTMMDYIENAGAAAKHIAEGLGPTSTIQGVAEEFKQHVMGEPAKGDPSVSAMKILGPITGLAQVSSGFPGGPAAGELHAQSEREKYELQKAMPAIRDKIKAGDTEGAMADMTALNVPPQLRRYYIRQTLQPGPSKGAMRRLPNAPGDVQERVRRQLQQAQPQEQP